MLFDAFGTNIIPATGCEVLKSAFDFSLLFFIIFISPLLIEFELQIYKNYFPWLKILR